MVSEVALKGLDIYALAQTQSCIAVTKVMKAESLHVHPLCYPSKLCSDGIRCKMMPHLVCKYQLLFILPERTRSQFPKALLCALLFQDFNDAIRDRN